MRPAHQVFPVPGGPDSNTGDSRSGALARLAIANASITESMAVRRCGAEPSNRSTCLACCEVAGTSDLVPYWLFEPGGHAVERRVPLIPLITAVIDERMGAYIQRLMDCDLVEAKLFLLENPAANLDAYNICTGRPKAISEIARMLAIHGSHQLAAIDVLWRQQRELQVRHQRLARLGLVSGRGLVRADVPGPLTTRAW